MDPFYICRCNAHCCCQHFVLEKNWQNEFYVTDGCRISFAVIVIIIIVFIKASVHHIDIHKYQQYMQYNMSFVAMALIWNISFFNFILFFFTSTSHEWRKKYVRLFIHPVWCLLQNKKRKKLTSVYVGLAKKVVS